MFNSGDVTNENNEDHDKKCSYIKDHPYIMLTARGSGSGKTNALLNVIKEQDDNELINKI